MTSSSDQSQRQDAPDRGVLVWDPVVRLVHWTVALGCIVNLSLLREADAPHEWVGYVVLGAVVIRLLWGIFGTPHARYADFVPTIPQFLDYARRLLRGSEPRYVGHNPAGALMMALLILSVATCGVSGWMMGLDRFWGEIWVESIHETSADVIMVAAVLHVLGAIFESVRHRENLPLAMITGRKRRASGTDVCHAPAADRR